MGEDDLWDEVYRGSFRNAPLPLPFSPPFPSTLSLTLEPTFSPLLAFPLAFFCSARCPPVRPRPSIHRQLPLLPNRLRRVKREVHSTAADLDGAQFGERKSNFSLEPSFVSSSSNGKADLSSTRSAGRRREGVLGPIGNPLEVESVGVRFGRCFADLMGWFFIRKRRVE